MDERTRTELVEQLSEKENEISIIVYGMLCLLPLLGTGIGYIIREPQNKESNQAEVATP